MGIEDKKSEGGNDLNEQQVESIVVRVLAAQSEKGKTTEGLDTIKKEVGELKGELGKVKEGMFCTADGKYCFRTPEELSDWMAKQGEKLNSVESKIAEVATQVKTLKPAPSTAPEGLKILPKMTEELRKGMSEEENRARDAETKKIGDYYGETDNDRWRRLRQDKANLDVIAEKREIVERVLKAIPSMPGDQKGKITGVVCTDKECRVQLEKEQGARIYKQDRRGKWKWLDEPEKEGPHI